jgi:hypothetical protein
VFGNERDVLFRVLVMYNLLALCLCYLRLGLPNAMRKNAPPKIVRATANLVCRASLRKQLRRLYPVSNLPTHSLHAVHTPIFCQKFFQFFDIPFCEAAGDSPSFDSLQSRTAYNNPSKAQILHSKHHNTISFACHGGTSILAYTICRRARGNPK